MENYLTNFLAPASAALAAFIAYLAVYKNSLPQVVVYYQPSNRQETIIELIIENIGTGPAVDIRFSHPVPMGRYGIQYSEGDERYLPTEGIPMLAPRQRLVFHGGQYGGLMHALGEKGLDLTISYKFNPPLWCDVMTANSCVLSVKHLEGAITVKSMEQAVVDAISGTNSTTIKSIRDSLRAIDRSLGELVKEKRAEKENTPGA